MHAAVAVVVTSCTCLLCACACCWLVICGPGSGPAGPEPQEAGSRALQPARSWQWQATAAAGSIAWPVDQVGVDGALVITAGCVPHSTAKSSRPYLMCLSFNALLKPCKQAAKRCHGQSLLCATWNISVMLSSPCITLQLDGMPRQSPVCTGYVACCCALQADARQPAANGRQQLRLCRRLWPWFNTEVGGRWVDNARTLRRADAAPVGKRPRGPGVYGKQP